jgi:integrase
MPAVQTQEGTVVERATKKGITYALRFIAYGKRRYLTVGREDEGWTREAAETELDNVMADVRRGIWKPPEPDEEPDTGSPEGDEDAAAAARETFHEFSKKRLAQRKLEVSKRMWEHEDWALRVHLWPVIGHLPMSEFDDVQVVDDYRAAKVAESQRRRQAVENRKPLRDARNMVLKPLKPVTINKTIDVLRSYLAVAVDYKLIAGNPAEGRRRRLKTRAERPVFLDAVAQIMALLDVAAHCDACARWRNTDREALVATLVLAGPRAHELSFLLWRDIDFTNNRLYVGRSKTDAGLREITMRPLLRRILIKHKHNSLRTGPDDPVFVTEKGKPRSVNNIRNRTLAPLLGPADALLIARDEVPLPAGVTPHKLRHTFASILVACGDDPASVMAQLGHTDPRFTLKVYTHMMRRDPEERARLKAYVNDAIQTDPGSVGEPSQLEAPDTRELVAA